MKKLWLFLILPLFAFFSFSLSSYGIVGADPLVDKIKSTTITSTTSGQETKDVMKTLSEKQRVQLESYMTKVYTKMDKLVQKNEKYKTALIKTCSKILEQNKTLKNTNQKSRFFICSKVIDRYQTKTNEDVSDKQCSVYFDGCNNCMMKDGEVQGCTKKYCEKPSEAKCLKYEKKSTTSTTSGNNVGLANPASTYCKKMGGNLVMETQEDGGQVGMCQLETGTCEEWALFRGECGPITKKETTPTKEEPIMCTMEYMPVCAEVQVQCVKAPCEPVKQTFGNKCSMNANKNAKFLFSGECETGPRE